MKCPRDGMYCADDCARQDYCRRFAAMAAFMVRVGQVGRVARQQRCDYTLPLFPLVLILDADGTLAADLKPLVEKVQA